MPDIGDLYALEVEFLDACIDALNTIPAFDLGLAGAPGRSFVSPGQSADDCCPQLTVWASAINEGANSPGFGRGQPNCDIVNVVTLVARIVRCVPGMKGDQFPDVVDLQAVAEQIAADGWALWNHVFNLHCAGQLFSECGGVYWDGLRSVTPSGGCGGWVMQVRVELDGYQETFAS